MNETCASWSGVALGDRPSADRDEAEVGGDGLRVSPRLERDLDVIAGVVHTGHARAGVRRDPALAERSCDLLRQVLVLERRDPRQRLDHRHVRTHRPVEARELEPDRAGPDDHGRRRDLRVPQRLVARDDPAGDLEPWQEPGFRARGDHDLLSVETPTFDVDLAIAQEGGGTTDDVDLAGLHQAGEAGHELVDDLGLERLDLRPVGFARRLDAPLLGTVDRVYHRGRLQQRLGGDAAAEQAGPAEAFVSLDDGDALLQLCGS